MAAGRSKRGAQPLSPSAPQPKAKKPRVKKEEPEEEENEYEAQRRANMARNLEILNSLDIHSEKSKLDAAAEAAKPVRSFVKKEKKAKAPAEPIRRSTRGRDSDGNKIEAPTVERVEVDEHPLVEGPVDIASEEQVVNKISDEAAVKEFAKVLSGLGGKCTPSQVKSSASHQKEMKTLHLGSALADLGIGSKTARTKVVKERIFSIAFHPGPQPLVVAGDKWGSIGFFDLTKHQREDRVFAYAPHSRPVSCLAHNHGGTHLFSCSYDSTVRSFDYEKGIFTRIFLSDDMLAHLAVSVTQKNLFVAGNSGDLYVLDPRSGSEEAAQTHDLHDRKIATVDAHPQNEHLITTASNDQVVKVWDLRSIKKSKPLSTLDHTLAITSAYFSPGEGNNILTTCNDNFLRVWNHNKNSVTKIKHNNQTGRYITNFRAVWDPKDANTFVIGNMDKKLDIYSADGEEVAKISDDECTAIPAVNAVHPQKGLVASGNGSGYINVWSTKA